MLPTAFHLVAGRLMGSVTAGNHRFEVRVLRLDDIVGALTLMPLIAGPSKLLTRHRLHRSSLSSRI